jgi:hypothetical protein
VNSSLPSSVKITKVFYVLLALLLVSLLVGLVEARGGTFVISPTAEAIETTIPLSPPDSVFGNMSVSSGFVEFFVTNPSNEIIYQNLKTSFDQFNFTADENGTYQMHFVNLYQSGNVTVSLSYSINFFIFSSVTIHISSFSTQSTTSGGIITTHLPHSNVTLTINPPGFPVAGQFWQISVFSQNQSSDGVTYLSPLPNATVLVKVIDGNQTTVYNSTTDEQGHLEFQFLPEYTDISFQAVSGGNESDIIALTQQAEHYVSTDSVDFMYTLSTFMTGITALSVVVLHFTKRVRIIFSWLIGAVLCLSLVQLVISVTAKLFWLTPWGYPENIFGFFTWTYVRYAGFVSIVLYAILFLLALYLGLRTPRTPVTISSEKS